MSFSPGYKIVELSLAADLSRHGRTPLQSICHKLNIDVSLYTNEHTPAAEYIQRFLGALLTTLTFSHYDILLPNLPDVLEALLSRPVQPVSLPTLHTVVRDYMRQHDAPYLSNNEFNCTCSPLECQPLCDGPFLSCQLCHIQPKMEDCQ